MGSFDDLQDAEEQAGEEEVQEEENYEKEDEDDEAIMNRILEREREYIRSKGATSEPTLEKINLNKLNDREVAAVKRIMDQMCHEVKPGDEGYIYDVERDFDPAEESNEWDKSSKAGSNVFNKSQIVAAEHSEKSVPEVSNNFSKATPRNPSTTSSKKRKTPRNPAGARLMPKADEEFDLDEFEDDFNDDLDEFDEEF